MGKMVTTIYARQQNGHIETDFWTLWSLDFRFSHYGGCIGIFNDFSCIYLTVNRASPVAQR